MLPLYLSLLSTDSERDYVTNLYHKFNRRLLGYAYKLSGDVTWAQDATQQVFLVVIEKIRKFTQMSDDEIAAYCFTIVKNLYIRSSIQKDRQVFIESMDELSLNHNVEDRVEDEIFNRLEYLEVKKAVSELPERKRMVVALKYGLGLSHSEISQLMGISLSSSQNLLSSAILQLRRILGESLSHETK